jgi:WD40-like Beta Propeller Repeat
MNRVCLAAFSVGAVIIGGGCDSTRHAATNRSTPPPEPIVRGVLDAAVPSRDGDRIAVVRHVGNASYLEVGPANRRDLRVVYTARDSCCGDLAWATRWLLVFDNDYRVFTLDVRSGQLRQIAGFSNFELSKDGRWAAGWAGTGPNEPETVGVVSITGTSCRVVPRLSNASDSFPFFSPDGKRLFFLREPFNPSSGSTGHGDTISVSMSNLRPSRAC